MSSRPSLEAALAAAGVVTAEEVEKARAYGQSRGATLEKALVAMNLASEAAVYKCVAKSAGLPFVDPAKARVGEELLAKVPIDQIGQNQAVPVLIKDGVLFVAIDDPLKTYVADNLAFFAGCEVRCALAPPAALKELIRKLVGGASRAAAVAASAAAGEAEGEDAPIIRLVEKTIQTAVRERASDIHLEPYENHIAVRYRIDGVLRRQAQIDGSLHGPVTSRLKILAAMDIAERRKPQDGRIDFSVDGRAIDIRTSVLPSNHGESIVMRLLDKEKNLLSLEALGFDSSDRQRFDEVIERPNGVVLVTGPTGSGKTTSLYAALKTLNRSDIKIITAEDPVEFHLPGINQCQVKAGIGLTFARILRAMLRQAPNVILVGEIRDLETAEIAIQAALTGHLVFSTLHTNDAPSAITRLIDMGVKPFLVSAAVQAIMAQRLVRVLCKSCKAAYDPPESECRLLGLGAGAAPLYRAVGCAECDSVGYRGRVGIFEMMTMDASLREMIFQGEPSLRIRDYATTSGGMRTLHEDGVRKVVSGVTSIDELLRVTAAIARPS